jgi:beta-fructofuranosidase
MSGEIKYPPKIPQRTYASTLSEQREQLQTDDMMMRFAASRERLSVDPYRPGYHYVNPESRLNDPNGLCYWQGRYHLFYQAYPPDDYRQHWGHAVSEDLVYWEDLPLAIYPGIEEMVYSGSTLVEENRVLACYLGTQAGMMIAASSDPLLLNWEKLPGCPVIPWTEAESEVQHSPKRVGDPCLWKEDEGYYALTGGSADGKIFEDGRVIEHLFFSQDLERWVYLGDFIEGAQLHTGPGEDGAVPYFWPIGDKHILMFASHQRGSQYFLGDYDRERHRFKVTSHGRLNHNQLRCGGVHAPTATPDGKGGLIVIHNINWGKPCKGWDHIMSLPRRFSLGDDGRLRIEPVEGLESLRADHKQVGETQLPANQDVVFEDVGGRQTEIIVKIDPQGAREICLDVCRSPGAAEYTSIRFLQEGYLQRGSFETPQYEHALMLDPGRSSLLPDVLARPPEVAPFDLAKGELLELRVFVDRSVVEVFANGTQCLAVRVYPERQDSIGVALRAQGQDAVMKSMDVWQMKGIW